MFPGHCSRDAIEEILGRKTGSVFLFFLNSSFPQTANYINQGDKEDWN